MLYHFEDMNFNLPKWYCAVDLILFLTFSPSVLHSSACISAVGFIVQFSFPAFVPTVFSCPFPR